MATSDSDAVERTPEKRRLTRLFGPSDDETTVQQQVARVREDSARDDEELELDGAEDARARGDDGEETTTTTIAPEADEADASDEAGAADEADASDEAGAGAAASSEAEPHGGAQPVNEGGTRAATAESALTEERSPSPASTSEETRKPERLRFAASVVQLYRYTSGEYVAVGAAGLAVLDHEGALARDLLVYDVSKRPLVRRKIDHRLSCELQKDDYITIKHNGAILFSALMRDESDWLAVGAEITIAHYVARRKSDGFFTDSLTMDVTSPVERRAQLVMGDSARVNYEAVRGGGSSSFLEPDVLAFKLIDETSERVEGAKVKLELGSAVPNAVVEGLVGCSRDTRRLILAPKTETEFVLYDITVTGIKKQAQRNRSPESSKPSNDVSAMAVENTPVSTSQPPGALKDCALVSEPLQHTPPSPLFATAQPWMVPTSLSPLSPSDVAVVSEVRRAVTELAEEVSALAVRARQGGTWIPPAPTGELKRAIGELTKARRVVMLPAIDVAALSLSDIRQLTVEAERLSELQDELRECRMKSRLD